MAVSVGDLIATLRASTRQFEASMNRAAGELKDFEARFGSISNRLKKVSIGLGLVAGGAAALGVAFTKSVVGAASESENLRVRLNALLGSTEEGGRAFKDMAEFAGRVPFEFREIMSAATQLAGVLKGGVDEINQVMPMIADLAAVSGLSIQQTTEQIVRAFSAGIGAADLFRERGITAMLGFQAGASVSAEETKKQIIKQFNAIDSSFRGASNELAKTWTGLMSMVADRWFQFRVIVAEAGLFDAAKNALRDFVDKLDELQKSGRLAVIAQQVSETIVSAVETAIRGTGKLLSAMSTAIGFIASNPSIASFGLVGFFFMGTTGLAVFSILGLAIDRLIDTLFGSTTAFGKSAERVARLQTELSRAEAAVDAFNQIVAAGQSLTKAQTKNWVEAGLRVGMLRDQLANAETTLDSYTDRTMVSTGSLGEFLGVIDRLAGGLQTFTLNTDRARDATAALAGAAAAVDPFAFGVRDPLESAIGLRNAASRAIVLQIQLQDDLNAMIERMNAPLEKALDVADLIADSISGAIADGLTDMVLQFKSVGDAMKDIATAILTNIVRALTAAIAKALVFRAVMSAFGFGAGLSIGKLFRGFLGFEHGGTVPGRGPVPALLHGGEFVMSNNMLDTFRRTMNMPTGSPAMAIPGAASQLGSGMNLNVDFSQIPAPVTPREVALNSEWQTLLRETLLQLEEGGFRAG